MNVWERGYGMHKQHLVIRVESTLNGNGTRTYYACGKVTDYSIDYISDSLKPSKCEKCLKIEDSL